MTLTSPYGPSRLWGAPNAEQKKCSTFLSPLLTQRHAQKCSWLHPSEEIRDGSNPGGITGEMGVLTPV